MEHCDRRAASHAACVAGKSKAIRIAMIEMATKSSMSVKPLCRFEMAAPILRQEFADSSRSLSSA